MKSEMKKACNLYNLLYPKSINRWWRLPIESQRHWLAVVKKIEAGALNE